MQGLEGQNVKRRIGRRAFLRSAAQAAALGTVSLGPWPLRRAAAIAPPIGGLPLPLANPNNAPIDYIVVMMMENRSFDHYFGWLTNTNQQSYADPEDGGAIKSTFHLPSRGAEVNPYRGCGHPDPGHSFGAGREQRAGGFLAGRNDEFAISYYLPEDIELYAKLARQFTVCDNYFCSLLGPTFPNREYMHSAQSGGVTDNRLPSQHPDSQHALGFTWPTIWDLCEAAGLPWGYYFVDLPATGLWGARLLKGTHHIEHFFADALAGTLPNVVFVDPGFTTGLRTDEHPHSDIRAGQAFVHNVLKALVESPLWPRTALFLNYDEWGGFFDHVQNPPTSDDSTTTTVDPEIPPVEFKQLGFRVPCTIVSPYSRKGVLGTQITQQPPLEQFYDHTSILKFIEWRFGLPTLTARDAAARNIGELLDFTQTPRLDAAEIVDFLPRVPITSLPCDGDLLSGIPGVPQTPDTGTGATEADDFQRALDSGYFERVGYTVGTKPFAKVLGR